jgi:hypothetical protein
MEDFFRTALPLNRGTSDTPDGILIRIYKDTTIDFPTYICKSISGGDLHSWAISNKEAFDNAMDKALALMGL